MNNGNNIIIIGAGLAGLSAAHKLADHGISSTIYEASDRAGGRAKTILIGKGIDELGGKEVSDGGSAKNIKNLCKNLNCELKEYNRPYKLNYLYNNEIGSLYDFTAQFQETHSTNYTQSSIDKLYGENPTLHKIVSTGIRCYEGQEIDELPEQYYTSSFARIARSLLAKQPDRNNGTPGLRKSIEFANGTADLVNRITDGKDIRYNHKLEQIIKLENGYKLLFDNNKSNFCKRLLLAVPLPILKSLVKPNAVFGNSFYNQLDKIIMGKNTKIIIPSLTTGPSELFSITDRYVCWFNETGTSLTMYYGGNAADISVEVEKSKLMSELKFLYPSVSFDWNIENWAIKIWEQDPFTGGSYSCPSADTKYNAKVVIDGHKIRKLFAPIDKNIFIAGEHVAIDNPATMEGAVESGITIASIMLSSMNNSL